MMTWGQYLLSTQFVLMMTGLSLAAAAAWIMLVAMRESADDNRETDRALATKRQRSAARASYRASASDFSRPNHQGTASDATSAEPAAAGAAGGAAVSHSDKVTTARGVDAQQTKSKTVHKSIETRALDTEHGPLTVTIEGDDTMLSTIVTVHDVGTACLSRLMHAPRGDSCVCCSMYVSGVACAAQATTTGHASTRCFKLVPSGSVPLA